MRALMPGAMTVFSQVWPVLKSLPRDRHALVVRELARSAGMSTVRFGAPLAKGTPSMSAA